VGWFYLVIAIILEVCGTVCMKLSKGMSVTKYSVLMIIFYIICFYFFSVAVKTLNLATSYAIWAGLGIIFITIISWYFFKESMSIPKIISILMIVTGVVGLRLTGVN
jgi:small multidrug resistance pump